MMRSWRPARLVATVAVLAAWVGVIVFDPLRMSPDGEPVDGLLSIFMAWLFTGVVGAVSLLPFSWRGLFDWRQRSIVGSVVIFALIVWFHVVASLRRVPYGEIDQLSTALVLVQSAVLMMLVIAVLASIVRGKTTPVEPDA